MKLTVREMILIALCASLMGVFSQLAIPLPFTAVPVTLQVFGIVIISIILETKMAFFTMIIYILLGGIGVPVFAQFNRGLGVLIGPTGGYIWGFIIMAVCIGWAAQEKNKGLIFLGTYIGLGIDYLFGVIQLKVVTGMDLAGALAAGLYPFIIKDIIMVAIAVLVALTIKKQIRGMIKVYD